MVECPIRTLQYQLNLVQYPLHLVLSVQRFAVEMNPIRGEMMRMRGGWTLIMHLICTNTYHTPVNPQYVQMHNDALFYMN